MTTPSEQAIAQYGGYTVADLRRMARERGHTGADLLKCNKEELIALCAGETTLPDLFGNHDQSVPSPAPSAPAATDSLLDAIARGLDGRIKAGLDEHRVIALIKEHMPAPVITRMTLPTGEERELPVNHHKLLPQVLRECALGDPVWLIGPTGTGKTHLAMQVAESLGRPFSATSFSGGTSEVDIFGCTVPDETGAWVYRESAFVNVYSKGGVHLLDEFDAADANMAVALNSALSNGHLFLSRENKVFPKHKDAVILVAANTWGTGANAEFVGRNPLDGATVDRFALTRIYLDYDTGLEESLVKAYLPSDKAGLLLRWRERVRKAINNNHLHRVMSTRTVIKAAQRMLALDWSMDTVHDRLTMGWSEDEKKRVA